MRKNASLFVNICIAVVIISLGAIVVTTDLNSIFLTVSAPIYSGNRRSSNLSLMINVSGNSEHVVEIKEILVRYNVDVTFFVTGNFALQNMGLVRDMAKQFEIGNHGFSGTDIRNMRESEQKAQIWNTHEMVRSVTATNNSDGLEMRLFSPPYGSFGRTTLRVAQALGYTTIMWSRDATDSNYMNDELVFQRATVNVMNGDIILLDLNAHTIKALPRIISYYLERGFGVVRISDNIG